MFLWSEMEWEIKCWTREERRDSSGQSNGRFHKDSWVEQESSLSPSYQSHPLSSIYHNYDEESPLHYLTSHNLLYLLHSLNIPILDSLLFPNQSNSYLLNLFRTKELLLDLSSPKKPNHFQSVHNCHALWPKLFPPTKQIHCYIQWI